MPKQGDRATDKWPRSQEPRIFDEGPSGILFSEPSI